MNNIGIMHGLGEGAPASEVEAFAWFAIAAELGDGNADKNLNLMAPDMSESDRLRGVDRAAAIARELGVSAQLSSKPK